MPSSRPRASLRSRQNSKNGARAAILDKRRLLGELRSGAVGPFHRIRHAQARGRVLLRLCHSLPPCHGARGGTSRDGQGRISRPLPESTRHNSRLNAKLLAAFNPTVMPSCPLTFRFPSLSCPSSCPSLA